MPSSVHEDSESVVTRRWSPKNSSFNSGELAPICKGALAPVQHRDSAAEVCIVTLQMFFDTDSDIAGGNWMTWQAYTETLQKGCSVPCEQINPFEGSGISAKKDAKLASYYLCDVCGIDGNGWPAARCGCCQEKHQETVACLSCIPKDHAEWIQADEDQHHWRCRRCRCHLCLHHPRHDADIIC